MFFTLEGSTSMIRRKGSRENSVATPVQCRFTAEFRLASERRL